MLNAEFVEKIEELAIAGVKVETIPIDKNQKMVVAGGKVLATFQTDMPFGGTNVVEFMSLIDAGHELIPQADLAVIQVTSESITITCDANKPHKTARVLLKLRRTAAFDCLLDWESNGPKTIATINKMLRTKLVGTYDEKYLAIFRQVEFARSGSTTIQKGTHRDTMGKSIDNAVKSAAGDLPEVIAFSTELMLNVPCEPETLKYYLDVNHDNETIGIVSVGDFYQDALRSMVASLIERLKQEFPEALVIAS